MTDKEKKARQQKVENNVTKLTLEREDQIKDYKKKQAAFLRQQRETGGGPS